MPRRTNPAIYDKIIDFINSYYSENFRSPSFREIANHFDMPVSTTQFYLNNLVEQGKLEKKSGSRGIKIINTKTIEIPIINTNLTGAPVFSKDNVLGYISINTSIIEEREFFAFKITDDSMIDIGIKKDDYVLVKKTNTLNGGNIVSVVINNTITLRRYLINTDKKMVFHPENDTLKDIVADDDLILGVAYKIIKDII